MTHRDHVVDGSKPNIPKIRLKYEEGKYDHTVDADIGALLDFIDEIVDALRESNEISIGALIGWDNEARKHRKTRALLDQQKEESNDR